MDEHVTGEPGTPGEPAGQPVQPAQPTVPAVPAVPAEVLDSTAPATWSILPDGAEPVASGRGRRRSLVAGALAAVVLVAGGGAYAWSQVAGNGPQPTEVLPAGTIAVLEVDLDPSAGQKLALYHLLQKFPDTAGLSSSDKDFADWLVRRLSTSAAPGGELDFARDVQPWLGRRFAVAAVPGAGSTDSVLPGSQVGAVVVLQETDEAAATSAMARLRTHGSPHLGYAFMDGYLVVTPDSATGAGAVVAAAQKGSLAADPRFSADVASLGSDQVVTAWVDAGRAGKALQGAMSGMTGGGGAQMDALIGDTYKGRYVLGVHATDDAVEMRVRGFDGGTAARAAAPVRIDHVVPDAFGVFAVSGAGDTLADRWSQLAAAPGFAELHAQAQAMGLDLPGDLRTLLGDQLDVSVGGGADGTAVLAAATSKDPQAGKAVLDKLFAMAGPDGPAALGVTGTVDGDTLYVATSGSLVAAAKDPAVAAKVTGSDLFKAAVADPEHAQVVLYVDLAKVWSVLRSSGVDLPSGEVQHLRAVGLSATTSGGDSDMTLRLVVG